MARNKHVECSPLPHQLEAASLSCSPLISACKRREVGEPKPSEWGSRNHDHIAATKLQEMRPQSRGILSQTYDVNKRGHEETKLGFQSANGKIMTQKPQRHILATSKLI